MSWRIVVIQNPAKLNLKNKQLQISQEDIQVTIPVEDICVVILEAQQILLSTALISFLQEHNVVVIVCDQKHIPNGIIMPFHQHSRQTEVAFIQSEWSEPFRKRCWQKIIQQKIINQSECLKLLDIPQAQQIRLMAERVDSGDRKNIEAQAAKLYWRYLFGSNFIRQSDTLINACLNYAYAIARAMICRAITGYGLLPCFGLHHKNTLNAFNLADDMIEPYRPIIDFHVKKVLAYHKEQVELTSEIRQQLIEVGLLDCLIHHETHTFHNAVEFTCSSLVTASRQKSYQLLKLPSLSNE